MAERLSVTTAIIGLLAVGARTMERIWDLNLPALGRALQEVKQCRSTVQLLYRTLCLLEAGRLPFAGRAAWIDVDELVSTLTDTVLAFSDLQAELDPPRAPGPAAAALEPEPEPEPEPAAGSGQRMAALCSRIRWQSLSMSLMMTILKCPSQVDAGNASVGLHGRVTRILTCNTALSRRMRLLQGVSGGTVAVAVDRGSPPDYSVADPEARAGSDSASPRAAGRAASPLSGYTLADIPVMSIVSLPVTTDELRDGSDVYTAAYARRMGRHLGQLAWSAEVQAAARPLEPARGRTDADGKAHAAAEGSPDAAAGADGEVPKKPRFCSIRVRRRCRACR